MAPCARADSFCLATYCLDYRTSSGSQANIKGLPAVIEEQNSEESRKSRIAEDVVVPSMEDLIEEAKQLDANKGLLRTSPIAGGPGQQRNHASSVVGQSRGSLMNM